MNRFFKLNSKAFSLIEVLVVVSIMAILMSGATVFFMKYKTDSELQLLKNNGDMLAKAMLNCMFYNKAKTCLPGVSMEGKAHNVKKNLLFQQIELNEFEKPLRHLKASWDRSSNERKFCFQFNRTIKTNLYKLCVNVDRKTKTIQSVFINKNFCCKTANQACVLPLNPKLSLVGKNVSSSYCKSKGFSDDFSSYLSRSGLSISKCRQGTCF